MKKGKIIIDPVYGFIHIPDGILLQIIRHPWFRRLSRIKQLGLNNEVYPGAQHTRFQHSLGAYKLMGEALQSLEQKGVIILEQEAEAALAAILLHDIGHGPFSHVLEHTLMLDTSHEDLSLLILERLNEEFQHKLDLAIRIFKGDYPRYFFHELICSQLDVDRLDYLNRDSFFTGVREGNIGTSRIIGTLDVSEEHIVVESKGLYSIENYLVTRRLMYWQVYLHKTTIAAEAILTGTLKRARHLLATGKQIEGSPALLFFLKNNVDKRMFKENEKCLQYYVELDDSDIWSALKLWQHHDDRILSILSKNFVNRNLFKVEVYEEAPSKDSVLQKREEVAKNLDIGFEDTDYFVLVKSIKKMMYSKQSDAIRLQFPNGKIRTMSEVSDIIRSDNIQEADHKYYFCYQRTC